MYFRGIYQTISCGIQTDDLKDFVSLAQTITAEIPWQWLDLPRDSQL